MQMIYKIVYRMLLLFSFQLKFHFDDIMFYVNQIMEKCPSLSQFQDFSL